MGGLTKTYCLSATVSTTAPAEAQCDQERSKGRGQMTGDPKVSNKITKTLVKTKTNDRSQPAVCGLLPPHDGQ